MVSVVYWILGILLGVGVLVVALRVRAQRRLTQSLGEIFVALQRGLPGARIGAVRDGMVEIEGPAGEQFRANLARMLQIFQAPGLDLVGRRRALDEFVQAVREGMTGAEATPAELRAELRPRLVTEAALAQMRELHPDDPAPAYSLGNTGLHAVLVQDSAHAVRFLANAELAGIGVPFEALLLEARQRLGSPEFTHAVRDALNSRHLAMIKTGDSYDAARLLLLPEMLLDGEEAVALVPDRDTLAVAPKPMDGDWSGLERLARTPGSDRLLIDRPVLVSRQGFRLPS